MNFLHLKYFLMVAEELNITRAAERLVEQFMVRIESVSTFDGEAN